MHDLLLLPGNQAIRGYGYCLAERKAATTNKQALFFPVILN